MIYPAAVAIATLLANNAVCSAAPDPIALLSESVAAVAAAPSASVDFSVRVRVVMGEESDDQSVTFNYRTGGDGGYLFAPAPVEGEESAEGVLVKSNGKVTLLQLLSRGRHTLEANRDGFADFTRSPLARGIGNGLGGLALSFLSEAAMKDLSGEVTASEYLGEEPIDGVPHHHLRYTVEDSLVWDAWIAAEGAPLIRRIVPDLTEMKKNSAAAKKFDNFDYAIEFDYANWDTDAGLSADDFRVTEPDGSMFTASFFERPAEPPHPLLGKPAPAFELSDIDGEPVNLSDHLGKDVVLLDFWATWCPPCVAALPKIDGVAKSFADRGVVFYAVNQQEEAEAVRAFLEQRGVDPPVLLDSDSVAANAYSVEGLPSSVLIGLDGTVQVFHVGLAANLESQLTSELTALTAGENLAAKEAAKWNAEQQELRERVAGLRSQLDD